MSMEESLNVFNRVVVDRLGFGLRVYQRHVASEIINALREGYRFIIVSMPTGSGKTLLEMFSAFYGFLHGFSRVLVLEPTRFLCDQMYSGYIYIGGVDYGIGYSETLLARSMKVTAAAS